MTGRESRVLSCPSLCPPRRRPGKLLGRGHQGLEQRGRVRGPYLARPHFHGTPADGSAGRARSYSAALLRRVKVPAWSGEAEDQVLRHARGPCRLLRGRDRTGAAVRFRLGQPCAARFTTVRYDNPGCGLSDREGSDLSFEGQVAGALAPAMEAFYQLPFERYCPYEPPVVMTNVRSANVQSAMKRAARPSTRELRSLARIRDCLANIVSDRIRYLIGYMDAWVRDGAC